MSIEELLEIMRQENAARFDAIDAQFERVDARFERIDARADATDAKIERLADIVAERTEHIIPRIELLAEGLAQLNAKLDRETADIHAEMRRGFAETQEMFRYAHADLDRRVTALEQKQ